MSEMPSILPDLDALRKGDDAAWDQLHDCLHPVAYEVAESKLGGILPQDVEDVAIRSFEALVPKIGQVKSVDELRPLIASIAYYKAMDRLRRHYGPDGGARTKPPDDDDPETPSTGDVGEDPEKHFGRKQLAETIRDLLKTIKPKARKILTDLFVHGRSHKEVAASLGLSEDSIGMYKKRALDEMFEKTKSLPGLHDEFRGLLGLSTGAATLLLVGFL